MLFMLMLNSTLGHLEANAKSQTYAGTYNTKQIVIKAQLFAPWNCTCLSLANAPSTHTRTLSARVHANVACFD